LRLRDIVGQQRIKDALIEQVLYFCQSFERSDMLNVCLLGAPGVGKSLVCSILCDLYQRLQILPFYAGDEESLSNREEKYLVGTRTTLIGKFVGQTAPKTKQLIDRCIRESKILLIDEVYQLNNRKADDSFSKEVMDTLNQQLTENPGKLIVIIAGYPEDVEACFFQTNAGLKRRFQYVYSFENYSAEDLRRIFLLKAEDEGWEVDEQSVTEDWFQQHKNAFPNQAGDIETLFAKVKMVHARRVFGQDDTLKRRLSIGDLTGAFQKYLAANRDDESESYRHMYT
jgi:SpoVK/Ycf46/Vps4 family AAA+-type ATPase